MLNKEIINKMATYAAFKHVELYNVGNTKKRYIFRFFRSSSSLFYQSIFHYFTKQQLILISRTLSSSIDFVLNNFNVLNTRNYINDNEMNWLRF